MFNPLTEKERINTTAPEISGPFHVELNAFRFFDGIVFCSFVAFNHELHGSHL